MLSQQPPTEVATPDELQAEALIQEARARQRRRRRGTTLVLLLAALVAAVGWLMASGGGTPPATAGSPGPAAVAIRLRQAGPTVWDHGYPPNYPAFPAATTVTCSGDACYAVVQAYGVEPGGAAQGTGSFVSLPLASSVFRSEDGGATWTSGELPTGTWLSSPLACPRAGTCAAGAVQGAEPGGTPGDSGTAELLTTTDGGRRWARHDLPATVGMVTAVACASPSQCTALTEGRDGPSIGGLPPFSGADDYFPTAVLATTDGGRVWTSPRLPAVPADVRYQLSSVACPSLRRCVVIGERARILDQQGGYAEADQTGVVLSSSDGGRHYRAAGTVAGLVPQSVACTGPADCLAVVESTSSAAVVLRTTDGSRWARVAAAGLPRGTGGPLACTAADRCVLADPSGLAVTTDAGRRWRAVPAPAPPATYAAGLVTTVSCLRSGTCLALQDMLRSDSLTATTRVLTTAGR